MSATTNKKTKINNILINNLINCYRDLIEIDDDAANRMHGIVDFVVNPTPKTWRAVLEKCNGEKADEFIAKTRRASRAY